MGKVITNKMKLFEIIENTEHQKFQENLMQDVKTEMLKNEDIVNAIKEMSKWVQEENK